MPVQRFLDLHMISDSGRASACTNFGIFFRFSRFSPFAEEGFTCLDHSAMRKKKALWALLPALIAFLFPTVCVIAPSSSLELNNCHGDLCGPMRSSVVLQLVDCSFGEVRQFGVWFDRQKVTWGSKNRISNLVGFCVALYFSVSRNSVFHACTAILRLVHDFWLRKGLSLYKLWDFLPL